MDAELPVALVTGAGRAGGLGPSIARALAADGYRVVVHFHSSRADADRLAGELGGMALGADLSDEAEANSMMARVQQAFGRLDVLVNNAGVYHPGTLTGLKPEEWHAELDSTVSACFFTTRAALPLIRRSPCGRIINMGDSACDKLTARETAIAYHIGKIGVLVLTRSFARQEAPGGLTVNMVSPGILENSIDIDEAPTIPAGRFGRPDDIIGAIRFLLRPESCYLNGSNLVVSGGWNL